MSTESTNDEKIIAIPKDKYLKITYICLLISSAVGMLSSFVGALVSLSSLVGLAGLLLAILGLFVFKDKFNEQQQSHFKYIGVLFLAFFVIGFVVGVALGGLGIVSQIIVLVINLASLACMFAGFKLNEKNAAADKDSVIAQLKSLGA